MKKILFFILVLVIIVIIVNTNKSSDDVANLPTRESKIPSFMVKITPETDAHPVKSMTDEYENPVPLPSPINTRGAEDSAFMMPDGNTLYVWFTPDNLMDVHAQLQDEVTGIYEAKKVGGKWQEPTRVMLQKPGKLAGDGCEFVLGNTMWFCTVREGLTGVHWFKAEKKNGQWQNWKNADKELRVEEFLTGELHISKDGQELYFHSSKGNDDGNYDIWLSKKAAGKWQDATKIDAVNSEFTDGWPALSPDETELWFTRMRGASELYRSKKVAGVWQKPELMFRPFAGESSMDNEGNIYFTHHYYKNDKQLEADIYVAYKK